MTEPNLREIWEGAFPAHRYLEEEIHEHRALWDAVYSRSRIPAWAVERAEEAGGEWKLLVLSEDWCGDAANTVPVLARFAEAVPNVEMRVVKRDEHPDLMDRYLTNGSRSIPIAVVLDAELRPVGRWGPRPGTLQEWVLSEKRAGQRPAAEIYRDVRAWYARDRGESTLRELLEVVSGGEA